MLQSLYGPKVSILNVLAAMGSHLFQLPSMLILFELRANGVFGDPAPPTQPPPPVATAAAAAPHTTDHVLTLPVAATSKPAVVDTVLDEYGGLSRSASYRQANAHAPPPPLLPTAVAQVTTFSSSCSSSSAAAAAAAAAATMTMPESVPSTPPRRPLTRGEVARRAVAIVWQILSNPPMAALILGLLYSAILRTCWRDQKVCEIRYPFWIDSWITQFGNCVTPVAAFTIGMFMAGREHVFLHSWRPGLAALLVKLLVMPLIALGLAHSWGFTGIEGRAAVLIAALPIAVAAFAISQKYFGESASGHNVRAATLIAGQVVIGSILMAPVFVAWNEVLESRLVFGNVTGLKYKG